MMIERLKKKSIYTQQNCLIMFSARRLGKKKKKKCSIEE